MIINIWSEKYIYSYTILIWILKCLRSLNNTSIILIFASSVLRISLTVFHSSAGLSNFSSLRSGWGWDRNAFGEIPLWNLPLILILFAIYYLQYTVKYSLFTKLLLFQVNFPIYEIPSVIYILTPISVINDNNNYIIVIHLIEIMLTYIEKF